MNCNLVNRLYNDVDSIEVTYCIPSYNHADYIEELLKSIKEDSDLLTVQYDLLILDDGSSDDSRRVIKKYIDSCSIPIRAIFFDNVGISDNLNRIKKYCRGSWIRLCASDDIIIAGSTQVMLNSVTKDNYCLIADGVVVDKFNKEICSSLINFHGGNKKSLLNENKLVKSIIMNYSLAGPCLLINSDVYDVYSYDSSSLIDDYDFFVSLLIIKTNSIKFIDEVVCRYRVHDSNTSKTQDLSKRLNNQRAMLKLITKFSKAKKFRLMLFIKKIEIISKILYLSMRK